MFTNDSDSPGSTSTLPNSTSSPNSSYTTFSPTDHNVLDKENQSLRFIIVPICALGIVVVLTMMVLFFLRKKRLDRLRHHLVPFYNFDPGEEEDWETELLEDNRDYVQKKGYKTMEHQFSICQTLLSTD